MAGIVATAETVVNVSDDSSGSALRACIRPFQADIPSNAVIERGLVAEEWPRLRTLRGGIRWPDAPSSSTAWKRICRAQGSTEFDVDGCAYLGDMAGLFCACR